MVDRGQYWHSNAAFRQGDNTTALQIWKNSGVWRDFVENTPPMPFIKLLITHLGTTDPAVISKYISTKHNPSTTSFSSPPRLSREKIYSESLLEDLFPHYDFYNKKGIGDDTLKGLKGGLATKGQMYQRFVFPIYNADQQIHGFSGRDMSQRKNAPKWKHVGRKTKWIYPYYIKSSNTFPTQESIDKTGRVFLVESIGDLLNLRQHGHYNVLVTFGLDISPKLICHLISLNDPQIILSFNNDADKSVNRGARAAVKNYLKLLNHFDLDRLRICLPTQNDFGDMSRQDFTAWEDKCSSLPLNIAADILPFAEKLAANKEIPSTLIKNLKILRSHVK